MSLHWTSLEPPHANAQPPMRSASGAWVGCRDLWGDGAYRHATLLPPMLFVGAVVCHATPSPPYARLSVSMSIFFI